MTVDKDTPKHLWDHSTSRQQLGSRGWRRVRRASRVPTFRPRGVTWRLGSSGLSFDGDAFSGVECLVFGDYGSRWDAKLDVHAWPPRLKSLYAPGAYTSSLDPIVFPASLLEITLGSGFYRPIDRVSWPPFLQRLTFGKHFNHPIDNVCWPASLQYLAFGDCFNRPVNKVSWPPLLQELRFGYYFVEHASVRAMKWPPSLKSVEIVRGCSHGEVIHRPASAETERDIPEYSKSPLRQVSDDLYEDV